MCGKSYLLICEKLTWHFGIGRCKQEVLHQVLIEFKIVILIFKLKGTFFIVII